MSKFSRRRMLLAMTAAPVSMLASGHSLASPSNFSVGEAMRYLCEEVFPSVHQKRYESRDAAAGRCHRAHALAAHPLVLFGTK
ncbi:MULTISPECIES: hypothetical protein [Cupriavidus]